METTTPLASIHPLKPASLVPSPPQPRPVAQPSSGGLRRLLESIAYRSKFSGDGDPSPELLYGQIPRHHTLVGFDIAGFGHKELPAQEYVRTCMYTMVRTSFAYAGLHWPTPPWREDRGDGVVATLPADIPTQDAIDPVVQYLSAELRRHNRRVQIPYQMSMRMAVHAGYVQLDDFGLTGEAKVHLVRLLDAAAFKETLARHDARLGLIVSSYVYHHVVQADRGLIDPYDYVKLAVINKELCTDAWVHLPHQCAAQPAVPEGTCFG